MELSEYQRRLEADPGDIEARLEWLVARSRLEGPNVLLEALRTRQGWNECHEAIQDLAIREVTRRLGDGFLYLESREWRCDCRGIMKTSSYAHRLASFRHEGSGQVFNLLPGSAPKSCELCNGCGVFVVATAGCPECGGSGAERPEIAPFLVARWPVTEHAWSWARARRGEFEAFNEQPRPEQTVPKTDVSWEQARRWAARGGLRLPSAHEWLYAVQNDTEARFFWGDAFDDSYVWYSGNSAQGSVGRSFGLVTGARPLIEHERAGKWNAFGLVDGIGNVWEWIEEGGVVGGSYLRALEVVEVGSRRPSMETSDSHRSFGFRLACSLPEP